MVNYALGFGFTALIIISIIWFAWYVHQLKSL